MTGWQIFVSKVKNICVKSKKYVYQKKEKMCQK